MTAHITPSPIRDAVFAALKQHGPMHIYQIADALDDRYTVQQIRGAIGNARHTYPGQFFRVAKWITKDQDKSYAINHLTAIFAAGKGKDAPKPMLTTEEQKARRRKIQARWREKTKAVIRAKDRSRYAKSAGTQINPWASIISGILPKSSKPKPRQQPINPLWAGLTRNTPAGGATC